MPRPAPARDRALLAVFSCLLVSLPLLAVRFPPITDLPLLAGQVDLFHEALEDPGGPYRIQWWAPNQLSYWILGASRVLAGPRDAGRLAVAALGVLWVLALFGLSRWRRRPAAGAVLACLFFFNHGLYYGFLSFVVGWPAFALWLVITARRPEHFGRREALELLAGAVLLYACHALWLAAGLAWLAIDSLSGHRPVQALVLRFASLLPLLLGVAVWYPRLAGAGFASATLWGPGPLARLDPRLWVDAAFGGLLGPVEPALLAAVAAWWGLALWQGRSRLSSRVDRRLLAAGAMFVAASLLLPMRFSNTIQFESRWLPAGLALLALALPAPELRGLLRRGLPLALLASLCLTTAAAWTAFERRELAGLEQALEALPEDRRLVGYDLLHTSSVVKGFPFFHISAYGQLYRGAELHFSFADHATSPVVFKDIPRRIPYTPGRVRRPDLARHEYAIIGAPPEAHRRLEAEAGLGLIARTREGLWRLYEIQQPAAGRQGGASPALRQKPQG